MRPILIALILLGFPTIAQALTPDELKSQIDALTAQTDPFQVLLNDPDPARSLAAVQLMLDSGESGLMRMAINFGLQSAVPEVRRAAIDGFLQTQPTLQIQLTVPTETIATFETYFHTSTQGSVLPDGTAIYSVNVGTFDVEKNCYLRSATSKCAVEVGPAGLTIRPGLLTSNSTISNLVFLPDGTLTGSTAVYGMDGGFSTNLVISE